MMELFSQWLLSVTACTLLVAVSEALMPQGAVKEVGKLVCGLMLFLIVVKPFTSLSPETLAQMGRDWTSTWEEQGAEYENIYNQQTKTIIEQELASYIVDKATEVGINCRAQVQCQLQEVYIPVQVYVWGIPENWQEYFTTMIVNDLGVAVEDIIVKEVEDE